MILVTLYIPPTATETWLKFFYHDARRQVPHLYYLYYHTIVMTNTRNDILFTVHKIINNIPLEKIRYFYDEMNSVLSLSMVIVDGFINYKHKIKRRYYYYNLILFLVIGLCIGVKYNIQLYRVGLSSFHKFHIFFQILSFFKMWNFE